MHNFNEGISTARFPDILKSLNQFFKKKSRIHKENYRPARIFPVISKIFEILMLRQLIMFFKSVFCKCLCGYWKGHSLFTRLLVMIEKWKK